MESKSWYYFRYKRKFGGYCPANSREGVAKFAGCPLEELVVKPVKWDGEKFVEVKA